VFPDSPDHEGHIHQDVRFDLARGAAGFAYIPGFLSGGGQRHHRGGSVHRQRGAAAGERSTVLPGPGFSARRWREAFVIQATVEAAPSLVSSRPTASRFSGGRQAGYYCPIASRNLYSVDARRAEDFPIRRRRAATVKNWATGRSGWLGSGRAGARLSDERGVQRHPAVRSVAGNGGHFHRRLETVVHNRHLVWPDSLALGRTGRSTYLDAGESFASFHAGQDCGRAAVLSVQGTDDATPGTR